MVSDLFDFRVCADCRKRSWVTVFFGGGTPLPCHAQRSLEVKSDREREAYWVEFNKLKINYGRLTQFYCWRNGRGQGDYRRWNPSEWNGGEHHCHCHHHHRRSGREDNGEALLCSSFPPPLQQSWTLIATVEANEWTKETLCSYQSLPTAPQVGPAAASSAVLISRIIIDGVANSTKERILYLQFLPIAPATAGV